MKLQAKKKSEFLMKSLLLLSSVIYLNGCGPMGKIEGQVSSDDLKSPPMDQEVFFVDGATGQWITSLDYGSVIRGQSGIAKNINLWGHANSKIQVKVLSVNVVANIGVTTPSTVFSSVASLPACSNAIYNLDPAASVTQGKICNSLVSFKPSASESVGVKSEFLVANYVVSKDGGISYGPQKVVMLSIYGQSSSGSNSTGSSGSSGSACTPTNVKVASTIDQPSTVSFATNLSSASTLNVPSTLVVGSTMVGKSTSLSSVGNTNFSTVVVGSVNVSVPTKLPTFIAGVSTTIATNVTSVSSFSKTSTWVGSTTFTIPTSISTSSNLTTSTVYKVPTSISYSTNLSTSTIYKVSTQVDKATCLVIP